MNLFQTMNFNLENSKLKFKAKGKKNLIFLSFLSARCLLRTIWFTQIDQLRKKMMIISVKEVSTCERVNYRLEKQSR